MSAAVQVKKGGVDNTVLGRVEEAPDEDVTAFTGDDWGGNGGRGCGGKRRDWISGRGGGGRSLDGAQVDGGLNAHGAGGEGFSGNGGNLITEFMMAEVNETTNGAGEGMRDRKGLVAAITGSREIGRCQAIAEVKGITKLEMGEERVVFKFWEDSEPSACCTSSIENWRSWDTRGRLGPKLGQELFASFKSTPLEFNAIRFDGRSVIAKIELGRGVGADY
ncbi:MAG TPA: hypothetical protein V6D20_08490 [Candidatus Obscuribacterales bacterium]